MAAAPRGWFAARGHPGPPGQDERCLRDGGNDPLGRIPARPSPWAKIGPALSRGGIGIGAVALGMGAYALWHRAQTNGGEPFAVARTEPAPALAPSPPRPPPAVASPAATQVGAAAG